MLRLLRLEPQKSGGSSLLSELRPARNALHFIALGFRVAVTLLVVPLPGQGLAQDFCVTGEAQTE